MAFSKIKTILSIVASSAVLLAASVSPSYAESLPDTNKFDQYRKSMGLSVKRLTTIAMNGVTNNKQKFRVPFKSYAVWNNMKGTLDYIKSGTKESIKIY